MYLVILLAVCPLFLFTQQNEIPFNAIDIIRQIRVENQITNSRAGEFMIDTTATYKPAPNVQEFASIAFDGTNYLVVWQDYRNGNYDIYGARVSPSGKILDRDGIAISVAPAYQWQEHPSVVFDGTNYLVVWNHSVSGNVYGARVSMDGTVLDTNAIAISNSGQIYTHEPPSVVFGNTYYLVVWQDFRNSNWDIYGARVSQLGIVIDIDGIAISTTSEEQSFPFVSFDGTNYLVVWTDFRTGSYDIYGARVAQTGTVIDPNGFAISTSIGAQQDAAVAFDGTNFLITWQDTRNGSGIYDIYGVRIDQSGTILDSADIAISLAWEDQKKPSLTWNGTQYFVVWQDERNTENDIDVYGTPIDTSGQVLDTAGICISLHSDNQRAPFICFDGINHLVVWHDERNVNSDIFCARVDQVGSVLDTNGIIVSSHAVYYRQIFPAAAYDGTNYLVAWQDNRCGLSDVYDIYGIRLDGTGIIVDSISIPISTAPWNQYEPSIAYDGTNYLVVWQDYRNEDYDIYGARVEQSGILIDTAGFAISTAIGFQRKISLAFDGTNYLVVWTDYRNGNYDIYGARISQSGTVLDSNGIAISIAVKTQQSPSIVFGDTNYLVVWVDLRDSTTNLSDIYGARINQGGIVLDTISIAVSTAGQWQHHPSIAFDGTNYFAAWDDRRNGNYDIYGARISQSGTVLDTAGIPVSTLTYYQWYPSIVFDSTNYLVAWQQFQNSTWDICGARVNTAGMVIDSFDISVQQGDQTSPYVVHGYLDQILIVYSGYIDSINGHTANTKRIWGKFYPFVGIDEEIEHGSQPRSPYLYISPSIITGNCKLEYFVPSPGDVKILLFDVAGRQVQEIFHCQQGVGKNFMKLDLHKFPAGVYFVYLENNRETQVRKIIIVQ
jgi:hypothetical protein